MIYPDSTTGRFRGFPMKDLQASANNSLWDEEESRIIYDYPISIDEADKGSKFTKGIPKDQLRQVGPFITAASPQTHIGPYINAIDFLIPDGTIIRAAADGVVVEIVEINDKWGDGEQFRNCLNFITIQHQDGEFSQYCHLAKYSVLKHSLGVGKKVKKGEPIAIVGKTGWTDRDHLHFQIFRLNNSPDNKFGFKSLKPKFSE
jgi:murein DD-endopeptidase MepM/ murein hydrolase activator NlpD